jgi:hypothetical protein
MSDSSDNSNPPSGFDKGMAWNRFFLFVGLLPFIPSFLLAVFVGKPLTFLAPLYGFCSLDYLQVHSSPPPAQILLWGCVTGIISIAFAIYAFFVKPFGILFAFTMWTSTIELLFKLNEALKGLHD